MDIVTSPATSPLAPALGPPHAGTVLRMGIDIGSTTVKLVLLELGREPDGDRLHFSTYRRHHADIAGELDALFDDVLAQFPDALVHGAVTGSGGLSVAQAIGLPFVQEVIAETEAIARYDPDTDVVIELGGEDAKITYLHPVPEQRMNGTCAGGTGAFIDQMATLLHTDAAGLDALAARYSDALPDRLAVRRLRQVRPAAAAQRGGGAHRSGRVDLRRRSSTRPSRAWPAAGRSAATSCSWAARCSSSRSCAPPSNGRSPGRSAASGRPQRRELYVAVGAALLAVGRAGDTAGRRERRARSADRGGRRDPSDAAAVRRRDRARRVRRRRHAHAHRSSAPTWRRPPGTCFLGIDAGSTTIKAVLLDEERRLLFSHYAGNEGDPVGNAVAILTRPSARRSPPPRHRPDLRHRLRRGSGQGRAAAPTTARSRRWPTTGPRTSSRRG